MKQFTKLTFVLLLAVLLLCGCSNNALQSTEPQADPFFEGLQAMANAEYQAITIKVATIKGDQALESTFRVTDMNGNSANVHYTMQEFATFSPGEPLPENRIETKEGNATIENGVFTSLGGEDVSISFSHLTTYGMTFKAEYFTNVEKTANGMTADIANPDGFLMGGGLRGENMNITVLFNQSLFTTMIIRYTTATNEAVSITYTFNN